MATKNEKEKVQVEETKVDEVKAEEERIAELVAKEVAKAVAEAKAEAVETVVSPEAEDRKRKSIKDKINAKAGELIPYFIPYVEGEPEDVTVGVNGKLYKIQKGTPVNVPRSVYEVLINSGVQAMEFQKVKKSLENQNLG